MRDPFLLAVMVTRRYSTLEDALGEIDAGTLTGASRIVVSTSWWHTLSESERGGYQRRCAEREITLSVDDRISRHFIEVSDTGEPPLSSERQA